MTLEVFRAEVLRHLPALASWDFSETRPGWEGRTLNARHAASNTVVWFVDGRGGEWWHIDAPPSLTATADTLPEAIATWRRRNAAELQALHALTVHP